MQRCQHRNLVIIGSLGLLLVLVGLFVQRGSIVLWMEHRTCPILDQLFAFITRFAEFPFVLVFIFGALYVRVKYSVGVLASFAIAGLLAQFLKKIVFADIRRPLHHYPDLHWVDGVRAATHFSFPSGHTTAIFAILMYLVCTFRPLWAVVLGVITALAVATSRIYLGLHFYEDVVAGALLGSFVGIGMYYLINVKFENVLWLNLRPLKPKAK